MINPVTTDDEVLSLQSSNRCTNHVVLVTMLLFATCIKLKLCAYVQKDEKVEPVLCPICLRHLGGARPVVMLDCGYVSAKWHVQSPVC